MGRFRDALAGPGLAAIAEVKRRSPSAGDLRPDADPAAARGGVRAGRRGSRLDPRRRALRGHRRRPSRRARRRPAAAARQGLLHDEAELDELKDAGADAALLILRDLDDRRAAALMAHAATVGLDTLVEAHDATELERAAALGADPIGINARDLSTFAIDRSAQLDLVGRAPRDRVVIAESAIHSRAHGAEAELAGADAVLVGTALMRAADPAARLRELISRPLVKVCGLTREEDVAVAAEAGADLCGFILVDASPRRAGRVLPVPDGVLPVAVLVGEPVEAGTDLVQLYPERGGQACAAATRRCSATASASRPSSTFRGRSATRRTSTARASTEGRVVLAGGLDAGERRARRSTPCGPGRSTRARASRPRAGRQGSRPGARVRRGGAMTAASTATTAAATSRRR